MFSFPINKKLKKGFTLIEILIVVAIIGFVSTISMTYMVTAQKQFRYISFYNQVLMATRLARIYAATDYTILNGNATKKPSAFCVRITKDEIDVFVQMNDSKFCEYKTDMPRSPQGEQNFFLRQYLFSTSAPTTDPNMFTLESYPINEVDLANQTDAEIYLSYEPRLESFLALICSDPEEPCLEPESPYILLKAKDSKNTDFKKYVVIFTKAGLVEGISKVEDLKEIGIPDPDATTN
ncbi:MAG: type II secretion system protein [Candidatus Gracilibacteria bacterium]|jgi:prepilin-type N-terminal cleavage/methylation domain-containing protein